MEIKLLPGEYYRANHKRFKRLSRALRYVKFDEKGMGYLEIRRFKRPVIADEDLITHIALKDARSLEPYVNGRTIEILKDGDKIIPIGEFFVYPVREKGWRDDVAIFEIDIDMLEGRCRFESDDIVEYGGKKYNISWMDFRPEIKDYTSENVLNTKLHLDRTRVFSNFYYLTEVDGEDYWPTSTVYSRELKKVN